MSTFFISNHHSFAGAERCRRDSNGLEVRAGVGKHAAELAEEARIWTSAVETVTRESLARSAPSGGGVSNLRFRQRLPCSVTGTRSSAPDTARRHADTFALSIYELV